MSSKPPCPECAALRAEVAQLAVLTRERDEWKVRVGRQTDWYQQRFNRLRRWVDEEVRPLSAETATRYFAICANGAPAPHESADWRGTMHSLTMERDAALAEVERLRKDLAHSEQRAGMHPSCPHCGRVTGNEELPDGRVVARECCVADIDRARAIRCGCPKEEP